MSTVILKWNPEFSSLRMIDFLIYITKLNANYGNVPFDWSVREHEKIKEGDEFFLVKVGSFGARGIVAHGKIISNPYTGPDWAGTDKPRYYVDLENEYAINPDVLPILTADELEKEIPDFDWRKGSSGVVLTDEQAQKLNKLWNRFCELNSEKLIGSRESRFRDRNDYVHLKFYDLLEQQWNEEENSENN